MSSVTASATFGYQGKIGRQSHVGAKRTQHSPTFPTKINNIYLYEGDIDGHLIDFLETIESEDNLNLYASVWGVDDDGEMVLTKNGKVVISKEPSSTLLRLLGNSLNATIFLWIQHGTSRSLADVQKLVHRQVLTK